MEYTQPSEVQNLETFSALGVLLPTLMLQASNLIPSVGAGSFSYQVSERAQSIRTPLPAVFFAAILNEFVQLDKSDGFPYEMDTFEHKAQPYFQLKSWRAMQKQRPPIYLIATVEDLIWYDLLFPTDAGRFELLTSMVVNCQGVICLFEYQQLHSIALPSSTAISVRNTPTPLMETAQQMADQHLTDVQFGVDKMAELMLMSRVTLFRRMKAEGGVSPHDFIFHHKLRAAWQLVTRSRAPISEIYEQVGFSSDSYFHQAFKRHFHVHPVAVRRSFQAKYGG